MLIGRLGIPFDNTLRSNASNITPCLIDLLFWGDAVDSNTYTSKDIDGIQYTALINKSNSIYFNGVSSKASITFSNDVLMYIDNIIDKYSEDGVNLLIWQTGDAPVQGLFELDFENRTLNIMFDGTNYKEGYQTHCIFQYYNGIEYITFLNYTFSEGLSSKTYNNTIDSIQEQYIDQLFPFGAIRSSIGLQTNLKIKI